MNDQLYDQLNKEKEQAQNLRADFIKRKLAFVVGLFGLGSININSISFFQVLYIIPFISIGFDVYILVEDFKVKRIGEFIKRKAGVVSEWEKWVSNHKNPYAVWAAPLFTLITTIGSCLILWQKVDLNLCPNVVLSLVWLSIIIVGLVVLIYKSSITRKNFEKD